MRIFFCSCLLAVLTALSALSPAPAAADSPLTSTDFATAYTNHPLVAQARKANGILDDALCAALSDPETPSDVRAAIINTLGWSIEGKTNAAAYLAYLSDTHKKPVTELLLADLAPQESFALGYLLAMDHYSDLSPIGATLKGDSGPLTKLSPQEILADAVARAPQDFTVALMQSLVGAQQAMDSDWCLVFKQVDQVIKKPWPVRNMKDQATAVILEYVALYAPECANPKPVQGP